MFGQTPRFVDYLADYKAFQQFMKDAKEGSDKKKSTAKKDYTWIDLWLWLMILGMPVGFVEYLLVKWAFGAL